MSIDVVIDVGIVLVGAVAAWFYLRAKVTKTNHEELEKLVETRGERIQDLEEKIDRLDERLVALEAEMEAVYKIKAKEIAELVVQGLNGNRP